MRKNIALVAAACLVLATSAMAGDPWKSKTPDQWNADDVKKILGDSPWAKQYQIMSTAASMSSNPSGVTNETAGAAFPSTGSPADSGSGGGGGRSGGRRGGGGADSGSNAPMAVYVAQWYSARTIRAAQARQAQLAGTEAPAATAQDPTTFMILLEGNLSQLAVGGEGALKSSVYLETKKTKQRIAPSKIHILQRGQGRVFGIVFEFPKNAPSGEPVIATDEKGVDFVAGTTGINLKFHYDLTKMVDSKGIDI